jgi:hypothetical protein
VLVAVAEPDLPEVLTRIPHPWQSRVVLLQNELAPSTWQGHLQHNPSVCIVWFEKKATTEVRVVLPSVCYGPAAPLLHKTLEALAIASRVINNAAELHFELALKNLYILTLNCAGLQVAGDVQHLWRHERAFAEALAREIIRLQAALLAQPLNEQKLLAGLEAAILADPTHSTQGRSAPQRLARSLVQAQRLGLELPTLKALGSKLLA